MTKSRIMYTVEVKYSYMPFDIIFKYTCKVHHEYFKKFVIKMNYKNIAINSCMVIKKINQFMKEVLNKKWVALKAIKARILYF